MLFLIIRIAVFFVLLAAFGLGLSWIGGISDDVVISFADRDYIMSPLILLGAILALLVVLGIVIAFVRLVIGGPEAVSGYFKRRRQNKGLQSIMRSLQYQSINEKDAALREAQEAHHLLHRPELTLLLTAQTAQAAGDEATALAAFEKLSSTPKTELVGIKGLLEEAQRKGDITQALSYAHRAYVIEPKNSWVLQTLFKLQIDQTDWRGAIKTLGVIRKRNIFPASQAAHYEAALRLSIAQDYIAKANPQAGLVDAVKALKLAPTLVPAAVLASRLLVADNKPRKAERLIMETWAHVPHPDLALAFSGIYPEEPAEKRNKRFSKLFACAPDELETKVTSIELDIKNEDFPRARDKLAPLLEDNPTARLCALQAAVVRGLGEQETIVRAWLSRALKAPRGMQWQCSNCAHTVQNWVSTCPACEEFDAIRWMYTDITAIPQTDILTSLVETQMDANHMIETAPEAETENDPVIENKQTTS